MAPDNLQAQAPRSPRGVSAIEMAVVLPVLLLLGIGCVDVGRAIAMQGGVLNAARVGADWAATHRFTSFTREAWESRIREEVLAEMQAVPGFREADLQVDIEAMPQPDGTMRVRVSASQDYVALISWPLLPTQIPIRKSLTVCQYQ